MKPSDFADGNNYDYDENIFKLPSHEMFLKYDSKQADRRFLIFFSTKVTCL